MLMKALCDPSLNRCTGTVEPINNPHFVATKDPKMKQGIRDAAEVKKIIVVVSSDEWLADLRQLGKGPNKPHIT